MDQKIRDQKILAQVSINPENVKSAYGYQQHQHIYYEEDEEEEHSNKLLEDINHMKLPFVYNDEALHDYDKPEDKNALMNRFSDESLKQQYNPLEKGKEMEIKSADQILVMRGPIELDNGAV